MDWHCDDAQVKSMAYWQAAAFHQPATQKEVHGTWITPPCLAVLGRKEYLVPVGPKGDPELSGGVEGGDGSPIIVLQKCAIHPRASPNVFCRVVQELHNYLVPMVEESDLFNMEKEIWEGVRKDPVATTPSKRAPSPTPILEEPTSATAPSFPPASELQGPASPEDLALVPRKWPPPPPGFLPWA